MCILVATQAATREPYVVPIIVGMATAVRRVRVAMEMEAVLRIDA
jgi:hypothetical protein